MITPEFKYLENNNLIVNELVDILSKHLLVKEKVLWLVSGGSAIEIAVEVSKKIKDLDLKNLVVTLTDERFGPVNHADSNLKQLIAAGFKLPTAKIIPVLNNKSINETVEEFEENLKAINQDYTVGLFGIGEDGHTAGILPQTLAVTSENLVTGYETEKFTRITITPEFLPLIDEAFVYARGERKWPVLRDLESGKSVLFQPAQALKLTKKLIIFSDYKGDQK
jgi:6-phosphogluconolactonase/glucosamine-6-phosphate isomerase/deaminase